MPLFLPLKLHLLLISIYSYTHTPSNSLNQFKNITLESPTLCLLVLDIKQFF